MLTHGGMSLYSNIVADKFSKSPIILQAFKYNFVIRTTPFGTFEQETTDMFVEMISFLFI